MDGGLVSSASCTKHQEHTAVWNRPETRKVRRTHRLKQRRLYWLAPSGHNIDWACTGQIPVHRGLNWGCSSQFPIGSSTGSDCKRNLPADEDTDCGCTCQGYIMSARLFSVTHIYNFIQLIFLVLQHANRFEHDLMLINVILLHMP